MTIDYGKTIHLPKSDFPRRAGLSEKEPLMQKRWEEMDLYKKQRDKSKGNKKFILHMGPPFANGGVHMGHLLSTVLKDMVCRSRQMVGFDAPLVPGFDCHGLPIEWKIEEDFRSKGKMDEKDRDPVGFKKACREFAAKWIKVQTEGFQRLGIFGDFKNPYITMDKKSEAMISREIHKFVLNDAMYLGSSPVMWSIPEQTALAEAEIEYKDVTSDTVYVAFPVKKTNVKALEGANVVIWTTTPWTLPANRAIAYGERFSYVAIEIKDKENEENPIKFKAKKLVLMKDLLADFLKAADVIEYDTFWEGQGSDLEGTLCYHPLFEAHNYYGFKVPLLAGDFVTTDTGSGFVHIAPGHGEDDYRLGMKNNIEVPQTVGGDGKYFDDIGLFAGMEIYTAQGKKGIANKAVMQAVNDAGYLMAKGQIKHSYPHSWRSKAPVIFRNTPQWFISMDKHDLRKKALKAIEKTKFYPDRARNRIGSMVEGRGHWCVSRQRAWGVPLAIFVNKKTGEILKDKAVFERIYDIFVQEGSDAWLYKPAQEFLGDKYKAEDFEQVKYTIDVWFESGCTQAYVLEERPELQYPADLYLEGSDQHRGWFQSSLLVGCGTRGHAPYKAILSHGFILDEKGYKMSKSEGNGIDPIKMAGIYGADILRLWAASTDYASDVKFGENILKGNADVYKRIRGTLCYILGNLDGFTAKDKIAYKDLSDMDKWVLHKVHEVDGQVRKAIDEFDFLTMITTIHNFCSKELSSFYFDICKDILYCEEENNTKRRAVQTVLDDVFVYLVHWLSPIICYTAEEAWLSYKGLTFDDKNESIFLHTMPDVEKSWYQPALEEKWQKIQQVRSVVTGALEIKRSEKMLGSALESSPKVYVEDKVLADLLRSVDFADICITSGIEVIEGKAPAEAFTSADLPGVAVVVEMAEGEKCERCWKYSTEVGKNSEHPTICPRCAAAL